MNTAKKYKIELGLDVDEIHTLLSGEVVKFNFIPTDDTEYEDSISIHIKEVQGDVPLSELMKIDVDNID